MSIVLGPSLFHNNETHYFYDRRRDNSAGPSFPIHAGAFNGSPNQNDDISSASALSSNGKPILGVNSSALSSNSDGQFNVAEVDLENAINFDEEEEQKS